MYLETMPEVLRRAGHKMVIDDAAKGITPLLRLEGSDEVSAAAKLKATGVAQ